MATAAAREWTPPEPPGRAAQLELAGCERIELGPILKELVVYYAERVEEGGAHRDSHRKMKEAGERVLASIGWRRLPVRWTPDPEKFRHPDGPADVGRFAAFPRELRPGDRMILPSPLRKPGYVWRPIVARAIHRRRAKKGGYYVEITAPRLKLQFDEDELIVIDRSEGPSPWL